MFPVSDRSIPVDEINSGIKLSILMYKANILKLKCTYLLSPMPERVLNLIVSSSCNRINGGGESSIRM